MNQITQMLFGAAQQLALHPLTGGIEAWLSTTFMVVVLMPFFLGVLVSIFSNKVPKQLELSTLLSFWIRYCVFGPVLLVWNMFQLVLGSVWRAAFPQKKPQRGQKGQQQRVRNTYNITFTLFGRDPNRNRRGGRGGGSGGGTP